MNTDKICLPSSTRWLTRDLMEPETMQDVDSLVPSLEEVLDQLGPLPKKFLFFGQADDELPVLLDLLNPLPGPVLIAGDAGAGKTNLLRMIARFVVSTHDPEEIQYGVITASPQEWDDLREAPHCVGIFEMETKGALDFMRALAIWLRCQTIHRQAVLLMIDGLETFVFQEESVHAELHEILSHGPARQIWPLATIHPGQCRDAHVWLKYFHTRVLGWTRHRDFIEDVDDHSMRFETLSKGREFARKENSQWIRFRLPRT